jgi:hypothetical protein
MKLSTTLPPDAAAALQAASQTPIPAEDPLARRKAIDSTIERIKLIYPQFFKEQDLETDQCETSVPRLIRGQDR